jgi:hypothetical protein
LGFGGFFQKAPKKNSVLGVFYIAQRLVLFADGLILIIKPVVFATEIRKRDKLFVFILIQHSGAAIAVGILVIIVKLAGFAPCGR